MIFFWALYHLLSYQLDSWEITTLVLFVIWLNTVLNSWGLLACSPFIHLFISSSLLLFSLLSCVPTLHSHGLRRAKLPRPLLSPGVCSNSCPLNRWCHPTILSCRLLLFLPSVVSSIRVFSNESALLIRWRKYWNFSFSFSPSNAYSELISFRIDWFDLLAVQGTLKSLL